MTTKQIKGEKIKEKIKEIIKNNSSCWNPYCSEDAECQKDRDITAEKIYNLFIKTQNKQKKI